MDSRDCPSLLTSKACSRACMMGSRYSSFISHSCTGREFFRSPVSDTSKTYRSLGRSPLVSIRAIPFDPRRTYLRMVSFHRSYSAQAVASGRWAKIISCS
ncbi:MAG: hypothetical protein IKF16_02455 [Lachnospiraceae bacterium]|nr:hypothetical protein [Lachnospiraceae bacterium]